MTGYRLDSVKDISKSSLKPTLSPLQEKRKMHEEGLEPSSANTLRP